MVWSGSHSPILNVLDTMRVPGLSVSSVGRSLRLRSVSRNIVITVALVRSVLKMSASTKSALPPTPAFSALRLESATMSGLYSTPSVRAPRFAAVITVRPSPEPRSITKSLGVTFAMSSILSTSSCGEGTHTTSLPDWPTSGWNSALDDCAKAPTAIADRANVDNHSLAERDTDIFSLQYWGKSDLLESTQGR